MTKKKQVTVSVSQNWLKISSALIEQFISLNEELQKNKRIKQNLAVGFYILYDLLYKRHLNSNLHLEYFPLNYDSYRVWTGLGNNFYKFFRFLLDQHIVKRWESETINKKTGKPFAYCYHSKGVAGTSAKYKLNSKIIKAIENQPEIIITLSVSEKNDYFFHTIPKYKKKLAWWKRNDVYGDYREPNEYELKVMERLKHIQVPGEYVEGQIEPIFIHGRIYQNGWTNLSKEYRSTVKYKGVEVEEVFDVPNCYVQFLATNLEREDSISWEQKKMFCYYAYRGQFYNHLIKDTKYTKEDIKPVWMHFLFCSSSIKRRGISSLRKIEDEQSVLVYDQDYIVKWNLITSKMKEEFPAVFDYLLNYPQIKVEGRNISKLSVDLQWRENQKVLNLLMKGLEQRGIIKEPIPLHDGIYITKDQPVEQLKQTVKKVWNRIINTQFRTNKTPVQIAI